MKKHLALGIVTLLVAAASAHADDQSRWEGRLFRFDFRCEFNRHDDGGAPATPAPAEEHRNDFDARATVFARVRDGDDALGNAVQAEGLMNRLVVERNGELIYADGAILRSGFRRVVIGAVNRPIEIVIPRRDHDRVTPEWMDHESFLVIGERVIKGKCEVRARPVRDAAEAEGAQPLN